MRRVRRPVGRNRGCFGPPQQAQQTDRAGRSAEYRTDIAAHQFQRAGVHTGHQQCRPRIGQRKEPEGGMGEEQHVYHEERAQYTHDSHSQSHR